MWRRLRNHGLTIVSAIGGFALGLYVVSRPRRVEVFSHGHIIYLTHPPSPASFQVSFALAALIGIPLVFAIWGRVIASLLAAADRRNLLRRYWVGWFVGSLGFLSGAAGPGTIVTGILSAARYATVGIVATWLYYRYTGRSLDGHDRRPLKSDR